MSIVCVFDVLGNELFMEEIVELFFWVILFVGSFWMSNVVSVGKIISGVDWSWKCMWEFLLFEMWRVFVLVWIVNYDYVLICCVMLVEC